jgi:hypothetical protein
MLVLFVAKTYLEYRSGYVNVPKTLLISLTVLLMFWTPIFPNMDTAFQGVNTWHSFQYLALTWYANRLREQKTGQRVGFLHWLNGSGEGGGLASRIASGLRKVDRNTGWTTFYMLCLAMLPISGVLLTSARSSGPTCIRKAGADGSILRASCPF